MEAIFLVAGQFLAKDFFLVEQAKNVKGDGKDKDRQGDVGTQREGALSIMTTLPKDTGWRTIP